MVILTLQRRTKPHKSFPQNEMQQTHFIMNVSSASWRPDGRDARASYRQVGQSDWQNLACTAGGQAYGIHDWAPRQHSDIACHCAGMHLPCTHLTAFTPVKDVSSCSYAGAREQAAEAEPRLPGDGGHAAAPDY